VGLPTSHTTGCVLIGVSTFLYDDKSDAFLEDSHD
jgi:hypothetical protein